MLRTRLLSATAAAFGLAAFAGALVTMPPAARADVTDGTLTVIVDRDVNRNGEFDSDDLPQPGIEIVVTDVDGGKQVDGRTDDDGRFVLEGTGDLTGGLYFVVAEIPADLSELAPVTDSESFSPLSTKVDVSTENKTVRMGVVQKVKSAEPTPESDASSPPPEAGPLRFAVGDRVWRDDDRSGTQAPSEPAVGGISVQLLNSNGDVVGSMKSSPEGRYLFDKLPAGTYSLRFAGVLKGYRLTPTRSGTNTDNDSDPDFTGTTPPFTLGVGEPNVREATAADGVDAAYINSTIDAGITPLRYAIGDRVWYDLDRDGIRQAGEPAAAATVSLLSRGAVIASTTTDAQGCYLFNDLEAGTYQVEFSNLPPHRTFTSPGVGIDPEVDSDADPKTGRSGEIKLSPGSRGLVPAADPRVTHADFVNLTVNAGLIGSFALGDTVWQDLNGNGVVDQDDEGVAGVTVELRNPDEPDPAEQVLATTSTSKTGQFSFDGLAAGTYQLKFGTPPAGLRYTNQRVGSNSAVDSDADANGLTQRIVLGDDNPADTTIDAGLTTPANFSAAPVPGAASAVPVDTVLSSTGGVSALLPVIGLMAILSGVACLVAGQQGWVR